MNFLDKTERLMLAGAIAFGPILTHANPAGEVVRSGAAEFVREGNSLRVIQGSNNVVIDWDSFSIAALDVTEFIQPGAQSIALNRVMGASRSQIDGLLKANGRIFLINRNGIVIGRGGQIDVGGFVASSLDVSDAEVLARGDMTFRGNATAGAVVNLGTINARDGDVFLFAPRVENVGTISAPNGTVGLGGGTKLLLRASGDERVFVEGAGTVVNSGTVNANIAELKAHGGNVYALAIKNSGRVVATGVRKRGGQIFLTGRGGKIVNSGRLKARRQDSSGGRVKIDTGSPKDGGEILLESDSVIDVLGDSVAGGLVELLAETLVINDGALVDASGAIDGGTITAEAGAATVSGQLLTIGDSGIGGMVSLQAENLRIGNGALLDASGDTGGGEIFAGGGFGGADPTIRNATTTTVADGAILKANSLTTGNAGRIIVWADEATIFSGEIEARALGISGDGGFAEVSGKIELNFSGRVNLQGAGDGFNNGTLLLDPTDFTIDLATATAITASLNGGTNVVVATNAAGAGNGDIFVNSTIITTTGAAGDLALLAHRNIEANQTIRLGTGDLTLVSGWDGVTGFSGGAGVNNGSTVIAAAIQGNAASFGNAGGDVNVNSAAGLNSVALGSRTGTVRLFGDALTLTATAASGGYARVGYDVDSGINEAGGDIVIVMNSDITLTAATGYAQIGNLGIDSTILGALPTNGNISVIGGGNLTLTAGPGLGNNRYASIGHGGDGLAENISSGNIDVNMGGAITISGGNGALNNFAMIGHVGYSSGGQFGNIAVTAGNGITATGGTGAQSSFAKIGHAMVAFFTNGDLGGTIDVTVTGGDLTFQAGTGNFNAYAQVGNGGNGSNSENTGNITVRVDAGNVEFTGGGGATTFDRPSFAQLGNGNSRTRADSNGTISLMASGDITFTGGTGLDTYALLGNGGLTTTNIDLGSNVTAIAGGDITFRGGTGVGAFAQGGNRGTSGDYTGNLLFRSIGGGTLNVLGSAAAGTYAQIGHRGQNATTFGQITVDGFNQVNLTGGGAASAYSQIGNGAPNIAVNDQAGFIQVISQGDITLANAQIGHATSAQVFGNTFIGVGQSDPTTAGSGTLTADAASNFISQPAGSGGELRFYAATRNDVNIALGTNLNGVALAADNPYPNEQDFFLFGAGPYSGDFSFYFDIPNVAPPQIIDPTGLLLPDIGVTGPPLDDTAPGNDPYTVENQFYGDDDTSGGDNVFRDGSPESTLVINEPGGTEGSGFSADPRAGGLPNDFVVPDGLVTDEFGIVGFGGGDDIRTASPPPEIAAILGGHLSEQAHVSSIPDGMVGPDNKVVSFGGGSGIVETFDTAGKVLTNDLISTGAFLELGSSILNIPQTVAVPDGMIQNDLGIVGFSKNSGIAAQMPPEEVTNALAEALGETAHDGSVRGPATRKLQPGDGVASFGKNGTEIPRTIDQQTDATFQKALNPAAVKELEAAFGL